MIITPAPSAGRVFGPSSPTSASGSRCSQRRRLWSRWALGLLSGAGGLVGGYPEARLQPHLPERGLRLLLGVLATALAVRYVVQVAAL